MSVLGVNVLRPLRGTKYHNILFCWK